MVTPGSNKKVWWICEKSHEWEASVLIVILSLRFDVVNELVVAKDDGFYPCQLDFEFFRG